MTLPNETSSMPARSSFGAMLFGHIVLFLFCVGLPAIFTAAAPLTSIQLTRESDGLHARVSKRLLFVVPFSRSRLHHVEAIDDQTVAGTRNPQRSSNSETSRSTQTESSGYLTIRGESGQAKIEVSPASIGQVRAKLDAFLADETRTRLHLLTIANWKFGVLLGGLLSLLTLFYIYLQLSSLVKWLRH